MENISWTNSVRNEGLHKSRGGKELSTRNEKKEG